MCACFNILCHYFGRLSLSMPALAHLEEVAESLKLTVVSDVHHRVFIVSSYVAKVMNQSHGPQFLVFVCIFTMIQKDER